MVGLPLLINSPPKTGREDNDAGGDQKRRICVQKQQVHRPASRGPGPSARASSEAGGERGPVPRRAVRQAPPGPPGPPSLRAHFSRRDASFFSFFFFF